MESCLRLSCIVMAAGNARRFGENKLARTVEGRSLLRRALEAVPAEEFAQVVVVTQYPEAEDLVKEFSFTAIHNASPELGLSHTIALGLAAVEPCDGALFQVADQPLLRRQSVAALAALWRAKPDRVAALGHGGVRGNPCIFPAALFPELLALRGDRGGSTVIRAHEEMLTLFEVAARELWDVDTPQALERLEGR